MNSKNKLSRRDFLKVSALALGGLAMSNGKIGPSLMDGWPLFQEEELVFPENVNLGRMCIGSPGANTEIRSEPSSDAPIVGTAWFDDVFEWRQEVMASPINPYLINQRWVETEKGYIYAENLQRVRYEPQVPLTDLPIMESGERGMWVEIVSP